MEGREDLKEIVTRYDTKKSMRGFPSLPLEPSPVARNHEKSRHFDSMMKIK